jgi:hypothetical protein
MVCEVQGAFTEAPPRAVGCRDRRWPAAARRDRLALAPRPPAGTPAIVSGLDRLHRRSMGIFWTPIGQCQCSLRRERRDESVPVTMTGTLIGSVVGPWEPRTQVRLLLRDERHALVREYYPGLSSAGNSGAKFEMRGLSPDSYTLEVSAPGFSPELLRELHIEPSCVTDAGTVHLMRSNPPRTPVPLRQWGSRFSFPLRRRVGRTPEKSPSARSASRPGWERGST